MSGWSSQRVAEVGELYDLLASTPPPGINKYEMEAQLGWSPGVLHQRIRDLRIELGDDNINLVCDPDGHREAWRYFLTGNLGEAREWLNNRHQDLESRLTTMHSVSTALVAASTTASVQGRRVRRIETTLRHLIEDLALMS